MLYAGPSACLRQGTVPPERFLQSLGLGAKNVDGRDGIACNYLLLGGVDRQRRLPWQDQEADSDRHKNSQHGTKYLEILEKTVIFPFLRVTQISVKPLRYGRLDPNFMNLLQKNHPIVPVIAAVLLASIATVSQGMLVNDERQLSFYHTHTGKQLDVVYSRDGAYVPSALEEINHFLFDFRTGDKAEMDPQLLDLIYDVREALGSEGTYQVVSAYRSPKTNEMLRGRSQNTGVAKNSQHLLGKAIDVRLEGVKTATLRDTAISMKRGGVGYYESSDFVHMDTGRVRRW